MKKQQLLKRTKAIEKQVEDLFEVIMPRITIQDEISGLQARIKAANVRLADCKKMVEAETYKKITQWVEQHMEFVPVVKYTKNKKIEKPGERFSALHGEMVDSRWIFPPYTVKELRVYLRKKYKIFHFKTPVKRTLLKNLKNIINQKIRLLRGEKCNYIWRSTYNLKEALVLEKELLPKWVREYKHPTYQKKELEKRVKLLEQKLKNDFDLLEKKESLVNVLKKKHAIEGAIQSLQQEKLKQKIKRGENTCMFVQKKSNIK